MLTENNIGYVDLCDKPIIKMSVISTLSWLKLKFSRALSAMDTLRSFKRLVPRVSTDRGLDRESQD